MTPQDHLIVIGAVPADRVVDLRAFLATMTLPGLPGAGDPANMILSFGQFDTIHFARLLVLEDNPLGDRAVYPDLPKTEPVYLCLMIDCDGEATELMAGIARECPALTQAFAFCADFQAGGDLERWMAAHRVASAASYVNWVGRTAIHAREEARLRELLRDALPQVTAREPQAMLQALRAAVGPQVSLTPIPPTPVAWRYANLFHLFAPIVVAAALVVFIPWVTIPVAVIGLILALAALRRRELTDPIVENPYDPAWVARLRLFEDHDVTNQYTAMGSIKPGRFRLGLELVILPVINWAARHIFTRGGLGPLGPLHFAHWVLID